MAAGVRGVDLVNCFVPALVSKFVCMTSELLIVVKDHQKLVRTALIGPDFRSLSIGCDVFVCLWVYRTLLMLMLRCRRL